MGRIKPNGLILLTLDSFVLPKKIDIGFEILEIKEYIPRPMKYNKYQKLGHAIKRCKTNISKICADPSLNP